MGQTKLRAVEPPSPARTPARAELADLISKHAVAVRRLAANETAQENIREHLGAAARAVEQSAASLASAPRAAARHLVAIAIGEAGEPPVSVKDARAAAGDAVDALAAAEAALSALTTDHAALEQTVEIQRAALRNRAEDVIRAEAPIEKILERWRSICSEYVAIRKTLEFFSLCGAIPQGAGLWRNQVEGIDWSDGASPWRAARAALEMDADLPLPEIE